MAKAPVVRRCEFCGHSKAAHVDGIQCALCSCRSEERDFVQQSLAFRGTLAVRRQLLREKGNLIRRISSPSTPVASFDMSDKATRPPKLITVSERNLQNAAVRLLPKHNKLVSPEVDYLRRVLGEKATQNEIDEKVQQVRKLPWSEIVRE